MIMKSKIVFAILFLFIAPVVFAANSDTINLVTPATGNTIDPIREGFAYTPLISDSVKECGLYINSETKRSIPYNDVVNKKMLYFSSELVDGTYNWSVYCVKQNDEKIISEVRTVVIKNIEDVVAVKSSGVFRGSMAHEFPFENDPSQQPVVVKKLAAGDFVWVVFKIAPSNVRKELYVRRFSSEQGKQYLILEDLKKNEVYKIFAGDTTTINITPSSINVKFVGLELNRATVMVSTSLSPDQTTGQDVQPVEPTKPADAVAPTPADKPADVVLPDQKPVDNKPADNQPADDAPKPGVFKRFFSWLTSIFGA